MTAVTRALRVATEAIESATNPCITCSFQVEGMVLLHMLRTIRADIPVLFLDTVHHFPETYAYRDLMAEAWKLNLVNLRASQPVPGLWQTSTDECCARHKVGPLFSALESYSAWFTGMRREQSPSRANLKELDEFTLPTGTVIRKVNPLASWSAQDVADYVAAHQIPVLPLYEAGYTSIGCEPCTSVPVNPLNLRSGRWQGEKLECGIHIQPLRVSPT